MNELLEITQNINKAYNDISATLLRLKEKEILADNGIDINKDRMIRLNEKETSLDEREKGVSNVENILLVESENKKVSSQIRDMQLELDVQRKAFVTHQEQVKNDNLSKRSVLDAKSVELNKKEDRLNEGLEQLKEDKKNLKTKVLEEIKKKL